MKILLKVIVFLLSGCVAINCQNTNQDEECMIRLLRECNTRYKTNAHFYPLDYDQLRQHCSTHSQNERCINNTLNGCLSSGDKRDLYVKAMNSISSPHIKDLCIPDSAYSKLFIKHGACLQKTIIGQKKCSTKYSLLMQPKNDLVKIAGFSRNDSESERRDKIRQICCWWSEYQICVANAARQTCGDEAALLVNDEFLKRFNVTNTELTYKLCLPPDKTLRFPACFIPQSKDPKLLRSKFENDSNSELDVDEFNKMQRLLNDGIQFNKTLESVNVSSIEGSSEAHRIFASLNTLLLFFYFLLIINLNN